LISVNYTSSYDNEIIPLLRRMINLEELSLLLSVLKDNSTYIDGIQLHNQILSYMPRLNKFTFSISTGVANSKRRIDLPSNEDIQRSFAGKAYDQVGSYVHIIPTCHAGSCHVYSLPYQFEDFIFLNNSFQRGTFDKVRYLKMIDSCPFEHKFFELIAQDFPFLNKLHIVNHRPQEMKQHWSTLIVFPHLILLNLVNAHVDYAEQFLFHKNTDMPCLLDLCIKYESLAIVTNNFTNDAARLTCAKLKRLRVHDLFVQPENFHQYFPLL
jgi:hypothetical protein